MTLLETALTNTDVPWAIFDRPTRSIPIGLAIRLVPPWHLVGGAPFHSMDLVSGALVILTTCHHPPRPLPCNWRHSLYIRTKSSLLYRVRGDLLPSVLPLVLVSGKHLSVI
jgi:hypothetical protein